MRGYLFAFIDTLDGTDWRARHAAWVVTIQSGIESQSSPDATARADREGSRLLSHAAADPQIREAGPGGESDAAVLLPAQSQRAREQEQDDTGDSPGATTFALR